MKKIIIIALFSIVLSGCGGSDGGGNSTLNVGGTWNGSSKNTGTGETGTWAMTLSPNGSTISGTWVCLSNCNQTTATISGTISGSTFTVALRFPDDTSCGTFDAEVSGNSMSGNFFCANPNGDNSGTWTSTKQ